jgi:competence protein ComEA
MHMRRSFSGTQSVFGCLLVLVVALSCVAPNAIAQPAPARTQDEARGVVNLNTASSEELERLPGIGPSRARAILELRTRLKRFARVEDLMRVKGIGRSTFRRLRPLLTLDGPTTL